MEKLIKGKKRGAQRCTSLLSHCRHECLVCAAAAFARKGSEIPSNGSRKEKATNPLVFNFFVIFLDSPSESVITKYESLVVKIFHVKYASLVVKGFLV
ncbi:hypothetical protein ACS0TY_007274 [Phlomoides rotata]